MRLALLAASLVSCAPAFQAARQTPPRAPSVRFVGGAPENGALYLCRIENGAVECLDYQQFLNYQRSRTRLDNKSLTF